MNSSDKETLVILADSARDVLDDLTSEHMVVHSVSPRVVVIKDRDATQSRNLASIPGVTTVKGPDLPREALAGLDEAENLFVEAWAMRQATQDKDRKGEGADWDQEGFLPPDPPRGTG